MKKINRLPFLQKTLIASTILGLTLISFPPYAQNTQPAISPNNQPPANVSYDSLRAMAYSGHSEEAIVLAEEYLKHKENSEVRVLLARMLAWKKEYGAARDQLQFVLSKQPGNYDANDALSDIEIWTGNDDRAIEVLTNALKYNPNNAGLMEKRELLRGKKLVAQGQRDSAILLAQNYLKTNDGLKIRVFLAIQLAANKQYEDARKQLEYVLNKRPSNTDASNALAEIEINAGNYKQAIVIIDNGLHYSPQNAQLLRNKALAQQKLTGVPAALPSASQPPAPVTTTVSATSSPPPASTAVAPATTPNVTATTTSKPSVPPATTSATSASTSSTSSSTTKASSGPSYEQLNKMAHTKGQRQQAIKLAQESLKQSDNSDVRTLLGLMLSWEGRYNEARTHFQIVLKQKPGHLDATKGLANVELWTDNDKRALAVIDTGLKYHPKNADLLKQRDRALGVSPDRLSPDKLRALVHAGQSERAKQLARAYLAQNENADIRLLLGLMESWDKNYDESRYQLETVIRNKPGYADASLALANVEIYTEHYQRALQVINNALRYDPNDPGLLAKRASLIQDINEYGYPPGAMSLFGGFGAVTPYGMNGKLNAVIIDQDFTYADDLKQIWKVTSLGYERYTPIGAVIARINHTDKFDTPGNQYLIEAYPHLFKGAYAYLAYGRSNTSYLARNYYGFEPFFSLPMGFEFSIGERILQFSNSITHLYTGSIAKYYGNYWFSFREYVSNTNSHSYYFTARRYFSTADSYISLTFGGGSGPSNLNLSDPEDISSDRGRTVRLNGQVPLTKDLLFSWLVRYSYDHFPNTNVRQETDVAGGLTYLF